MASSVSGPSPESQPSKKPPPMVHIQESEQPPSHSPQSQEEIFPGTSSSPDVQRKKSLRSRFGAAIRRSASTMSHVRPRTVSESDHQQQQQARSRGSTSSSSSSFFLHPKETYRRRRTKSNGLEADHGRSRSAGETVAVPTPLPVFESPIVQVSEGAGVEAKEEVPLVGQKEVTSEKRQDAVDVKADVASEVVAIENLPTSIQVFDSEPAKTQLQALDAKDQPQLPSTSLRTSSGLHSKDHSFHSVHTPDSGMAIPLPTPNHYHEYLSSPSVNRPRVRDDDEPTPSCSIRTLPSIDELHEEFICADPFLFTPATEETHSQDYVTVHQATEAKHAPAPAISYNVSADSFLFSSAADEDITLSHTLVALVSPPELLVLAPADPFAKQGWVEHTLPTGTTYFAHSSFKTVADFELRDQEKFQCVMAFAALNKITFSEAVDGMELWIRRAAGGEAAILVCNWVDHEERLLWVRKPELVEGPVDEDERLAMEHHYWRFVEAHPAHVGLPDATKREAMKVVSWSYADTVLPDVSEFSTPFTRDECSHLLQLLRTSPDPDSEVLQTRLIARIFIRLCKHNQAQRRTRKLAQKFRETPLPTGHASPTSSLAIANEVVAQGNSIRHAVVDLVASSISFGIPYFYLERSNRRRVGWVWRRSDGNVVESTGKEEETRPLVTQVYEVKMLNMRAAGPMVVIGACTCLSLAWSLSRRLRQLYPKALLFPWLSASPHAAK